MKITSVILSFYVFFLSTLPVSGFAELFSSSMCCQEACSEKTEDHTENKEDGCHEVCNPFLSCSCSIGFTPTTFDIIPETSLSDYDVYIDQLEGKYLNQIIFQVWNPPKA